MDAVLWTIGIDGVIFLIMFWKRNNLPLKVFCLALIAMAVLGLLVF